MRIALIADLHGNWPATQALERDLALRGADRLYCLGDLAKIDWITHFGLIRTLLKQNNEL